MTALAKLRDRFNGARHTKDFCVDADLMAAAFREIDAALSHEGEAKVQVKPLDLSNLLKHAFLSGVVAARNIPGHDECIGPDLWVDYDPTANPAYDRILSAIDASPAPKERVRRDWHYDQDGYCDNPARGY